MSDLYLISAKKNTQNEKPQNKNPIFHHRSEKFHQPIIRPQITDNNNSNKTRIPAFQPNKSTNRIALTSNQTTPTESLSSHKIPKWQDRNFPEIREPDDLRQASNGSSNKTHQSPPTSRSIHHPN